MGGRYRYTGRKHTLRKLGVALGALGAVGVTLCVLVFAYVAITDYRPGESEKITPRGEVSAALARGVEYSIISADIQASYKDKDAVSAAMSALGGTLVAYDFALVRGVDQSTAATFGADMCALLSDAMPGYESLFAADTRVPFVPFGEKRSWGVRRGLLTMSRTPSTESVRLAFTAQEPYFKQLFLSDVCFTVARYALPEGQLAVIQLRLPPVGENEPLWNDRLTQLWGFVKTEAAQGKHVLIGGGWGRTLSDIPCPEDFAASWTESGEGFVYSANVELAEIGAADGGAAMRFVLR